MKPHDRRQGVSKSVLNTLYPRFCFRNITEHNAQPEAKTATQSPETVVM
jgi:hypothetical protein